MIGIKELFLFVVRGFKRLLIVMGVLLLACAIVWGVISGFMTIFGAIEFQWWNIPCWVLIVFLLAACLGQNE